MQETNVHATATRRMAHRPGEEYLSGCFTVTVRCSLRTGRLRGGGPRCHGLRVHTLEPGEWLGAKTPPCLPARLLLPPCLSVPTSGGRWTWSFCHHWPGRRAGPLPLQRC